MTPQPDRTPEPTDTTTDATSGETTAADRIKAADRQREDDHAEAERRFWATVRSEIDSGAIRQVDVVKLLGLNRETVRRNIKKLDQTE
ncbi:hypothetical protein [Kitasatospora griseola]|uniref:hypothetical protein n=1 Tax=Kitasatospora griseola TaxID=2064 RepID=UPI003417B3F2